jgi:hypothetical protein
VEDVLEEIGKGFLRAVGWIFAEILFGTVCYWIGWPVCRAFTLGAYPRGRKQVLPDSWDAESYICSSVGFLLLLALALHFAGAFSQ